MHTLTVVAHSQPILLSKTLEKPHGYFSLSTAAAATTATFASLTRKGSFLWPVQHAPQIMRIQDYKLQKQCITEASKRSVSGSDAEDADENVDTKKKSRSSKKISSRGRKKTTAEAPEISGVLLDNNVNEELNLEIVSSDDSKKVMQKGRKKVTGSSLDEVNIGKKVAGRRRKNVIVDVEIDSDSQVAGSPEYSQSRGIAEGEKELVIKEDDTEDISFTYGWPPLVCCFGAAQHAFIPSGRPSNRLIDYEIHETMKDAFWHPTKIIRAPGGSSSAVAVALASLGGRVAFMGKVGDDEYGQSLLYHLNDNQVQTRSVRIDSTKPTAVSHVKISRRGGLRATCIRPCAEDSFLGSEINIDVLKEAKMFYFNSSVLFDANMKTTTMEAVRISKKFGGVIFFDLNLPFPLWQSREETKLFIKQAWNHADVIEVTKQELEFLCDIEPIESFDTKDNDKSKFVHYKPEVVIPLWHENLKVLFVTNGTSKIHYYTEKDNGWVHGMEDAPLTPFTADMSVSGDAVVAALMRMLTVQPHLITDKGYLEHMIKYAMDCGVIDQWLVSRIRGYPPAKGMEGVKSISEREYRTVGPESD